MGDIAIKVDQVSKVYHLYNRQRDRLKDALNLTKKKVLPGAFCFG